MSQPITQPPAVGVEQVRAPGAAKRHLHQVDLVRILTFACVIGVHVVSPTTDGASVVANGLLMLLHFTRETFFALTGFVLTYSYLSRPLHLRPFWARRYLLVGVPYLAWSVIYFAINVVTQPAQPWSALLGQFATNIAEGTAWYHLYFLLVSLQVYLFFPLLLWLLRATRGHHGLLLGVSAAIQLALTWVYMYRPPTAGVLGGLMANSSALVISYQFYVLLGALAAMHFDRMHEWVCGHLRLIGIGVVVIGALTEGWYLLAQQSSHQPWAASAVMQPAMLPWSVAATAGLYALGVCWARARRESSLSSHAIAGASNRSFGVFLAHPAVLWVVLTAGSGWLPSHLGAPWLSVVAYVLAVLGALAVTEVAYRSWLSLALTGRQRKRSTNSVRRGDYSAATRQQNSQRQESSSRLDLEAGVRP
jgi:peptidoglycan/LPS O-acetylase OafA/YrhL